jgi:cation:H+ antiporter
VIYVAFAAATVAVFAVGPRLARVVETIADRLGIGQVLVGAVLLGVVTSLAGLVLTVTAAARGEAELAVANALGGVAAQTFFIAIADLAYRPGTLSSRVPTRQVTLQAAFLLAMLSLIVLALGTADASWWRVHPITPVIVIAYVVGLHLSRRVDQDQRQVLDVGGEPPTDDADTEGARGGLRGKMGELEEEPSERVRALESASMSSLWLRFATFAAVLGGAGFTLAWAGSSIAEQTPLSATSVGVLLTAVATSTPELVTAVAAARAGAIGLAAGDIIGGNVFDTLFVAAADIAQSGSIFAAAGGSAVPLAGLAMLLNSLLLAGLVRQGGGTRNVDAESIAIAGVWSVGVIVLVVAG